MVVLSWDKLMERKYGFKPDVKDPRDFRLRAPSAAQIEALPSSVDLRFIDSMVFDQGPLGSCTPNAAALLHRFCRIREGQAPIIPSRLMLYYNARKLEGTIPWDAGSRTRSVLSTMHQDGNCKEENWPYDVSKFAVLPSMQAYNEGLEYTALRYASLVDYPFSTLSGDPTGLNEMKVCLASGYPFIFGFNVYGQFETNHGGDIMMPGPGNSTFLGGHCCMALGYDDNHRDGDFLCRNSWGPNWGYQGGHFWMPYQYMNYYGIDKWTLTYEGPSGIDTDTMNLGLAVSDYGIQLNKLKSIVEQMESG